MGLDNFPKEYPCKANGTAVLNEDGLIVCEETQQAGGCPWLAANPPSGRVYGIFGCDCWYRGKHGNYLLNRINGKDDCYTDDGELSFYADDEETQTKSADSCREVATFMLNAIEDDVITDEEGNSLNEQIEYAAWWLNWAADVSDGAGCW